MISGRVRSPTQPRTLRGQERISLNLPAERLAARRPAFHFRERVTCAKLIVLTYCSNQALADLEFCVQSRLLTHEMAMAIQCGVTYRTQASKVASHAEPLKGPDFRVRGALDLPWRFTPH